MDLGAAPGGWSQVAAKLIKADDGRGAVVALDILALDPIPNVMILQQDFSEPAAETRLLEALNGRRADAVLSDMAAPRPATARPITFASWGLRKRHSILR